MTALTRLSMSLIAFAATLLLALGAVACGGSDDGDDGGTGGSVAGEQADTGGTGADGGSGTGESSATRRPEPYAPDPGTEEQRAYVSVDGLYDTLGGADLTGSGRPRGKAAEKAVDRMVANVCDLMSKAALKQIQESSPALSKHPKTACLQSLGVHLGKAARNGALQRSADAVVTDLKVDGDRGTAMVSFGGQSPKQVGLVKENGKWKLDAVPEGS